MSNKNYIPRPVFDTLSEVTLLYKSVQSSDIPTQPIKKWLLHCLGQSNINIPSFAAKDYLYVLRFIYSYRGSKDTFNAYRRELERLLQWSWFVREQSILKHKREDIEAFVEFCIKPYKRWIGLKKATRFQLINGEKTPAPDWRPFEARITKRENKEGLTATKADYQLSQAGLKALFAILSSFYNYLLQEEAAMINPVILIRQKSKFIRKQTTEPAVRRLSDQHWQTIMKIAKRRAKQDSQYERDVFILSCLYGMYLRISELISSDRWSPTMGDFFQDGQKNWWFKTVGKGNKARQIAVSDAMIAALKHYRTTYLELTPYPIPGEKTPLIGYRKNSDLPITSDYPIRLLVQSYFDEAAEYLAKQGNEEEANILKTATVHWLRHTGISEDIKHRPREHVRDDAGHSSSAITDRYIDVELVERAKSAKKKPIITKDKDDVI